MHRKFLAIPLVLAISACAQVPALTSAVQVPDMIKGAANESLAVIAAARGVQIYECRAGKDTASADWAFVAPEAELFDASGKKIGKHFAGPRWESIDGSVIAGTTKARIDAPQADAIPWLLLSARSVGPEGAFSKVESVQRVNTVGGNAPATGCSAATVGQVARVPYTADYYFLVAKPSSASVQPTAVRGYAGGAY